MGFNVTAENADEYLCYVLAVPSNEVGQGTGSVQVTDGKDWWGKALCRKSMDFWLFGSFKSILTEFTMVVCEKIYLEAQKNKQ